jgi:hypothetical protein
MHHRRDRAARDCSPGAYALSGWLTEPLSLKDLNMMTNTLTTHTRPEFLALLDQANQAHSVLEALDPRDPGAASALAAWTGACLRLVTSISNRAEALALDGLDGRSSDDWIRYLLSLGITQD